MSSSDCSLSSLSSIQSEDLPSDILDFISSAAPDTVFADYTDQFNQAQQYSQQQQQQQRYGSPIMYNNHCNNNNHRHSNHFSSQSLPNYGSTGISSSSDSSIYHHHHHGNAQARHHGNSFQMGRSPTLSECSSSDTESSIDGSPLLSEFIPLPVQSYKEGVSTIDLESFADVEAVVVKTEPGVKRDTDEDSLPCSPEPEQGNARQRRKRPSRRRQKQLWEFILETLTNPAHNPECITWVDKDAGIFKFVKSQSVARLWGQRRQREMSYEYFSRAM